MRDEFLQTAWLRQLHIHRSVLSSGRSAVLRRAARTPVYSQLSTVISTRQGVPGWGEMFGVYRAWPIPSESLNGEANSSRGKGQARQEADSVSEPLAFSTAVAHTVLPPLRAACRFSYNEWAPKQIFGVLKRAVQSPYKDLPPSICFLEAFQDDKKGARSSETLNDLRPQLRLTIDHDDLFSAFFAPSFRVPSLKSLRSSAEESPRAHVRG